MNRALLVGDTDYSHQSLEDMESDLRDWCSGLSSVIQILDKYQKQIYGNNYWREINPNVFGAFGYAFEFFKTSRNEIVSILSEINTEICNHHIKRLGRLGKTAIEVNNKLRKTWHEASWEFEKDYGNPNFLNVDAYYREANDMAMDMIDLQNLASRLDDFVGLKRESKDMQKDINSGKPYGNVKVFISYSWDNDEHKRWVKELAIRLRKDRIDIILDQWELIPGDQIPAFMENAVRDSDYVLIICTKKYKERSDKRLGGVGYEGDIMTAEVLNVQNQRKFIPILRQQPQSESLPSWLAGKFFVDLSSTPFAQEQYNCLISTLLGTKEKAPPLGSFIPEIEESITKPVIKNTSNDFSPIGITGVIEDQVGIPRNDGTRGCALYKIPFRLSKKPPQEWEEFFIENWNHPPRFSLMHRPGIASIVGDTIILDGTTIEEVKMYHRDTLILAVEEANKMYAELLLKTKKIKQIEEERISKHINDVKDLSNQINFNNDKLQYQ